MQFVLTEEQQEFRGVARDYFERVMPVDEAVLRVDGDKDAPRWRDIVEQLGVNAVLVPENLGGLGGGFLDLAMVIEEAGRALADLPLCGAAMAVTCLRAASAEASDHVGGALLRSIADSPRQVVLLLGDRHAERAGEAWRLSGDARTVPDAADADDYLMFGAIGGDGALFRVSAGAAGVDVRPVDTIDPTRRYSDVSLSGVEAELVAIDHDGSLRALAVATGRVALALDAAGGARKALEIAVDYARTREQFGKPIGSFQAIKHKCADMLLAVESATSAAEAAAWSLASGADAATVERLAVLAKAYACDAYLAVAAELIQILGGVGFTWEHPAHLFFTRAKANCLLLGEPEELRRTEAQALGIVA